MKTTLMEDLLSENRYWTFWKPDWSKRIYVFWNGKTPWEKVIKVMSKKLGADLIYERQVTFKSPQIKFK